MKILHLESSAGWGGQEIRILREAEGMREKGHEVIFCVMRGGKLIDQARKAGFLVYKINFNRRSWFFSLPQLMRIMARHKIDLINTHSSLDAWLGGIAGRIMKKAIVRTRHLSTPVKPGLNSKLLYGKLADFVVTTCSAIIPMIQVQSGKSESSFRSVPTGVDPRKIQVLEDESKTFREKLQVRSSDFLVGTACFMRSWKGIEDFLKAADLLREYSHIRWVIIGGGHAETYRKIAQNLKLDSIVQFTGHLENPFPAIAALDAFTLLSTGHEGVSQAILQAAYLQKPLVATPVGGLAEVCISGQTGVEVSPFSPKEVAEAVMKLSLDRSLCREYGERGKKLVEQYFTINRTLEEMQSIYDIVLNRSLSRN